MIKIKIYNPVAGKNRISFMGFLMLKDALKDYSIEITESDDYDYAFLGADDILDKGKVLQESIEYGLDLYPYGCIGYPSSSIIKLYGPVYPICIHIDADPGPPLNENINGLFELSSISVLL